MLRYLVILVQLFITLQALGQQYNSVSERRAAKLRAQSGIFYSPPSQKMHPPPEPEQDCSSAIPVCQDTFVQTTSYSGSGSTQEIPGNTCLGDNELNSVWYILNIQQGGDLEFDINPLTLSDDYDFALYDITGANCADIASGALLPVRCNYCVDAGVTGISSAGANASEDCCTNSPGCQFSSLLPVNTAETYVLIISNFSSTQNGYMLDFGPSSAVIFDTIPPAPISFTSPCGANTATLNLTEPVLCNSIASDGTDFLFSGPGGPFTVTGAVGLNCGDYTSDIEITFSPPLTQSASYDLTVTTGTDGNTVIDNCGNELIDPTVLTYTALPPPTGITGNTNVCAGTPTTLSASSGGSYLWNTGATTQTITVSPTSNTTYSVTIGNGSCSQSASITVNVSSAPTSAFTGTPNPACVGDVISFSNSSSTGCFIPSLLYTWNFGDGGSSISTSPTHTYTAVGTYTVSLNTIDLFCGCDNSTTVDIVITSCSPCSLTVSTTQVSTQCNGSCDGSALATPASGTSPYTYLWDATAGNQTTATATGLCAGSYTVSVTDNAGCVETSTIVVTEPGALGVSTTFTAVSCNGAADGTATATPSGGASPYLYNWSNGQQTSTATGLIAGTYTVTVTDNNTCPNTATVTVTEPTGLGPTMSSIDENCGAADGSATVTLAGGTAPFTYLWSNGQSTSTDTGLVSGVYTVTITDASGCSTSLPVLINSIGGASVSSGSTNISCNGANDGTATVTASGGSPPYTYLWSDLSAQTNNVATGLSAGTYTVSVTDTSGCISVATETITEASALTLSSTNTPASCGLADGTASVTVSGGTGTYTYLWSPSGGSGNVAGGLISGIYTIDVTDSAGCVISDSITVSNSGGPVSGISNTTDASCFSVNDGTATVAVAGGTSPLTYSWSPGGGTDTTATGLGPGTYTVIVTDAGGCITTASALINSPPDIVLTMSANMISCAGNADGSASVVAVGGVGGYTYLWSPTGGQSPVEVNLGASVYTVLVTDSNGCSKSDSVTISEPVPIVLALSSSPATCGVSDGSAVAIASGGAGNFTYAWSPSGGNSDTTSGIPVGVFTVLVTDGSGCTAIDSVIVNNTGGQTATLLSSFNALCTGDANGTASVGVTGGTVPYTYLWSSSPAQTDSVATGLSAGGYNCTVTDAGGCIAIVSVTITEPLPLVITTSPDSAVCPGATVTLAVSTLGGTLPYYFTWDNGLVNDSVHTLTITQDITYTVIVVDSNLCTSSAETISYTVGAPVGVTIQGGSTPTCPNQPTILTAAGVGGTPAYTFDWDNGDTGPVISVSPSNTTIYHVTVTDGCGTTADTLITVTINPDLVLNPPTDTICPGETTTIQATGALFYWWLEDITLDTIDTSAAITVSPLVTTNYIISAGDGICPNKIDTAVVVVLNSLSAAFVVDPEVATIFEPTFQFTDLTLGNPISWIWEFGDGATDTIQHPSHTYLDTGKYLVKLLVTDINGCRDSVYFTVVVKEVYSLFAPNSFSPNGDGVNDYFFPQGIGIQNENFQLFIFNRWGDLIFVSEGEYGTYATSATELGWDGTANHGEKAAQNEVYIWMIKTSDPDKARHQYVGHVTLLK